MSECGGVDYPIIIFARKWGSTLKIKQYAVSLMEKYGSHLRLVNPYHIFSSFLASYFILSVEHRKPYGLGLEF